jgi:cell division protein FtsN
VIGPKSVADAPDPNKPAEQEPPGCACLLPAPAPPRQAPKGRLAGRRKEQPRRSARPEPKPGGAITESKPDPTKTPDPKSADAKAAETKAADPSREERSSFLLQAGAFRTLDDAESMRGKLALLGYEARVLSADVNGQTMYRVRVGPYPKVDDVNQIRSRLAENGIEAAVVRQR